MRLLVLALAGETVVGQCAAAIMRHVDKGDELYLDNLGVTPPFHRLDLGRSLVEEALAWGRDHGCRAGPRALCLGRRRVVRCSDVRVGALGRRLCGRCGGARPASLGELGFDEDFDLVADAEIRARRRNPHGKAEVGTLDLAFS